MCAYIRGTLMRIYFGGLIEASSRALMYAACMRRDWDISRVTIND